MTYNYGSMNTEHFPSENTTTNDVYNACMLMRMIKMEEDVKQLKSNMEDLDTNIKILSDKLEALTKFIFGL